MKIRFTQETYTDKTLAHDGLEKAHWKEIDGNYDMLISLYQSGHTVHISDLDFTDTVILDLDKMDDKQANDIHDVFYIMNLTKKLGVEHIEVFESASRAYNKQKLFIKTKMNRNLDGNKDLSYIEFRTRFEEMTGIVCDSHMDAYTQITFGINLNDSKYNMSDGVFTNAVASTQPKKLTNDILIERKYTKPSNDKTSLEYFMKIFRKPSDTHHQIGISKKNILGWVRHWYENKYNKSFPEATKYRIIAKTYTPYMRVVNDCGVRRIVQVIVQDGARHLVANKLVDIIAFNAFSRSVFYRDIPSITDCYNRLSFICNTTFEKKDNKNWIECWKVEYIHKLKVAYLEYLNNTDWSEYQKDDDLMDYIATHSLALEQDDIQWTYRPNDIALERFTKDSVYMYGLMDLANKNIEDPMNYYMIWDRIGNDCGGDVELMCKLMAALRRRVSFKIPKVRCDKNGHHKEHKEHKEHSNKGKCLEGLVVEDNKVYIPKNVKVSSSIRKYCSKNNIKIIRS